MHMMFLCCNVYITTAGLDVQRVKQAHFLILVAKDLQSDIGEWYCDWYYYSKLQCIKVCV